MSRPAPSVVQPTDHTMANRNMPSTICTLMSSEMVAPEEWGEGGVREREGQEEGSGKAVAN